MSYIHLVRVRVRVRLMGYIHLGRVRVWVRVNPNS